MLMKNGKNVQSKVGYPLLGQSRSQIAIDFGLIENRNYPININILYLNRVSIETANKNQN